jgi:hypothetical protein
VILAFTPIDARSSATVLGLAVLCDRSVSLSQFTPAHSPRRGDIWTQRVFWGIDLTRLPCPYRQAVTLFAEELDFLSDADRDWVTGRGIAEWLNWPLARA